MHREGYATLSGFDGDDDDWSEEYHELCEEKGWDKAAPPASVITATASIQDPDRTSAWSMMISWPCWKTNLGMNHWVIRRTKLLCSQSLRGWTSEDSMGSDDELKAMLMELRMPRKRARTRQGGTRKQDGCIQLDTHE